MSTTAGKCRTVQIQDVSLHLGNPVATPQEWIGQTDTLKQLLACWLVIHESDLPLAPRLVGPPGIGKTTLAMAAARERSQDLYIYQCTSDTRPEDLLITPVLAESGTIAYHASPLVTAMITGGICLLDEGNRMSEKSWASLAPPLTWVLHVCTHVKGASLAPLWPGFWGFPRPPSGPPALHRIDHRRDLRPGASGLPMLRYHERRRIHL